MTALSRGHVVALRRGGAGVVWRADAREAVVIPVWGTNGPPRHRAEVLIEDLSDIIACGVSLKHPAVRCNTMHRVEVARLVGDEPLGRAPAGLMARIMVAVTREVASQQMEERLQFLRPQTDTGPAVRFA